MRKYLIIILSCMGMLLASQNASAQIAVIRNDDGFKHLTILSLKAELYYHKRDSTYHIHMPSTNEFDDSYWLNLGNREQAIEGLQNLLELVSTLKEDEDAQIWSKDEKEYYTAFLAKGLGIRQLNFKTKYRAGYGILTKSAIKKALEWFDTNYL